MSGTISRAGTQGAPKPENFNPGGVKPSKRRVPSSVLREELSTCRVFWSIMNPALRVCFYLPLLLCFTHFAAAQSKKALRAKAPPNPALAAIADTPGLPRVLIIGDTVSIGYTLGTRKLLEGKANVHRIPQSAGSSQLGAEQVAGWLGAVPWDVIHFNFGACDLLIGKTGSAEVPREAYADNLRTIISQLRAHSPQARLIFATTTPIPEGTQKGASPLAAKDAAAYAGDALKVTKEQKVRVNDLHAVVAPKIAELQLPGNIHFRAAGWDWLAKSTAGAISAALADKPVLTATTEKAASKGGKRVFTCGHSFHVWVVPLLAEMALGAGITDHTIAGKSSIGGSTVQKHWDVPEEQNLAKKTLSAAAADVLTLSPIWLPDDGIENFATLAVKHNPRIRITVQKYWLPNDEYNPVYPLDTRKKIDHDACDLAALQKAQDAYDRDIDTHIRELNTKLHTTALVSVPVGQATVALRRKIIAGECPGIMKQSELFRDNWGHPTQPIMALAGYCHYAVIYGKSPIGLPIPAILRRNPAWNEKLNRLLQELAWEAVQKHVPKTAP